MTTVCIAWAPYSRRLEMLGQHLNAPTYCIAHGERGRVLQAPWRYARQTRETWALLKRDRPQVILVQNPPIVGVLVAHLYAQRHSAKLVIDSHSGAFLSPKWRWSLGLHRLLSKSAITTIVTNNHLQSVVNSWGSPAFVLGFTPGHYPPGEPYPFQPGFKVVVISTFDWDEPIETVFEAARELPEVNFYVTGNPAHLAEEMRPRRPANCHLTGFLPYNQYVGLLRGADIVMDLTTRDHTLLLGAFESIELGTPLITSDWPILREYFSRGALHIANTVEGVCNGVRQAQREMPALQQGILQLREQLNAEATAKFHTLQCMLGG